jgi:hypothetical protein
MDSDDDDIRQIPIGSLNRTLPLPAGVFYVQSSIDSLTTGLRLRKLGSLHTTVLNTASDHHPASSTLLNLGDMREPVCPTPISRGLSTLRCYRLIYRI